MNLVEELSMMPGVFAAGEYAYRGDRYSCTGLLGDDDARMASIMCRATTMGVHMQAGMLETFSRRNGLTHPLGWVVRGQNYSICVMGNVFCFVNHREGSLNEVLELLRSRLQGQIDEAMV